MGFCAHRSGGTCYRYCNINFVNRTNMFPMSGLDGKESDWFGCRPYHLGYMCLMLKDPCKRISIYGCTRGK